jgi:TolA-binding protein
MKTAQWRVAMAAVLLAVMLPAAAQTPPDPQGLIRERDQSRERLRQEDIERAQREQANRAQAERAARQRLESNRIERMQAPQIVLPGTPPATTTTPQPGVTDPSAELRRSEAAKRDQREYDNAVRARQDLDVPLGSTIGTPGTWKPIGANK